MVKLSKAQLDALRRIERRDWPAGPPKISWLYAGTFSVLKRLGLIEERFPDVLHLTPAGRTALEDNDGK